MKIKFERGIFLDGTLHIMRKGEPWELARVTMVKNDKYVSFLVIRKILLTKHFKKIYRKYKQMLDKED